MKIHQKKDLIARVDHARLDVYNSIINVKGAEYYFVENLFNAFISLVQAPVSFAVHGADFQPLFHFCTDKEHRYWFEEMLAETRFSPKNTVPLLPDILREEAFHVSIHLMDTKNQPEGCGSYLIQLSDRQAKWQKRKSYIAHSAQLFFAEPWKSSETMFPSLFANYLRHSLDRLSENHRFEDQDGEWAAGWPPYEDLIQKSKGGLQEVAPNSHIEDWSGVINRIFGQFLADAKGGMEAIVRLRHTANGQGAVDNSGQPANIIAAYRSFYTEKGQKRHLTTRQDRKTGADIGSDYYPYDTRFIIPKSLAGQAGETVDHLYNPDSVVDATHMSSEEAYFEFLYKTWISSESGFEVACEAYGKSKETPCLFGDLFKKGRDKIPASWADRYPAFRKVAKAGDELFWSTLAEPDRSGIKELTACLRSKVGEQSRSLVDPVYSTGLIHFNKLFDCWGLDRILTREAIENPDRLAEISQSDDLLRIVTLYYLFCGMVSWEGEGEDFDPKNLVAIIVPVKIRGSVWGATIHASFYEGSDECTPDWDHWFSNFLLTTSHARKVQENFDEILWEQALRRVARLLMRHLQEADGAVLAAIEKINAKIRAEQLVTPYALPQFKISRGQGYREEGHTVYTFAVDNPEGDLVWVDWEISENPFFQPRQPWVGTGTRSFLEHVRLGVDKGLTAAGLPQRV